MSSTTTEHKFTKKQLFDALASDQVNVSSAMITDAKNGEGQALNSIGWVYQHRKQQLDKAMAWYRLSAEVNDPSGQNNMGYMYQQGEAVPTDYLLAMEWYLKSAKQYNKRTYVHIGELFENGQGMPVNKYKAAEWYYRYDPHCDDIKRVKKEGISLTESDRAKPITLLIKETEETFHVEKYRQLLVNEQNEVFIQLSNALRGELKVNTMQVNALEKEVQLMRNSFEKEINSLKRSNENWERMIEQERKFRDNEITLVKKDMEIALIKERQENRRLRKEVEAIKNELKSLKNNYNEDNNNDLNYDTE